MVFTTQTITFVNNTAAVFHMIFNFKRVFQTMLNLYLLLVNVTSLHLHEFTFIICNLSSQVLDTKPLKFH